MAAYHLDHPAGIGEVAEPFVDSGVAYAGGLHQVRDGRAARIGRDQSDPQRCIGGRHGSVGRRRY